MLPLLRRSFQLEAVLFFRLFRHRFFLLLFVFKWIRCPACSMLLASARASTCVRSTRSYIAFWRCLLCIASIPAVIYYMLNVRDREWIFGTKADRSAWDIDLWPIGASEMKRWQTEGWRTRKVEKEPNKQSRMEKKTHTLTGKKRIFRGARVNVLNAYLARNSWLKATHTKRTWKSNRKTLNINFILFICACICATNKCRLCALRVMRDSCAFGWHFFYFFCCCCCCY